MEPTINNRIDFFDNLKFLLILFVVIGHWTDFNKDTCSLNEFLSIFIYSFHMPLFIFLSGLFFKPKKAKQRFFTFGVIGFLMEIMYYIFPFYLNPNQETNTTIKLFSDNGPYWFLYAVAVFNIVMYLLRDYNKIIFLVFAFLMGLIVGFDKSIGADFFLLRIFVYFPFFILGQTISVEIISKARNNLFLKIISAVVIIVWIIAIVKIPQVKIIRPFFRGEDSYIGFDGNIISNGIVLKALSYIISIIISCAFLFVVPDIRIPLVTKFGARTLQVYFWHLAPLSVIYFSGIIQKLYSIDKSGVFLLLIPIAITLLFSLKPFAFPAVTISKKIMKKS